MLRRLKSSASSCKCLSLTCFWAIPGIVSHSASSTGWACSSKGSSHIFGSIYHTYTDINIYVYHTHKLANEYGTLLTGTPSSLPRISLTPCQTPKARQVTTKQEAWAPLCSNCFGKVGALNHTSYIMLSYCMDRKWGSLSALFACNVHVEI